MSGVFNAIAPILGGAAGFVLGGGPWGAAAGSALGETLAGGNVKQALEAGALGYLGGTGYNVFGSAAAGAAGAATGAAGAGAAGAGGAAGVGWGMPTLGQIGGGLSVLSSYEGMQQQKKLQQMAAVADPFAPYRAQYAAQLQQLQANPSSLVNTPGYQAGLQALQRTQAAQGFLGSGNAQVDLLNYGGQVYNQQMQLLESLAGQGGAGVGTAANIQGSAADLMGSSLGALGYGTYMMGAT